MFILIRTALFTLFSIAFFPVLGQDTENELKDISYTTECFYPEFSAEFPGGYGAMFKYFAEKTDHIDLTHKPEGLLVLGLTIAQTGEIEKVVLLKSLDPELDSLALNAAKEMLAWTPASHNGEMVHSSFTLPVRFQEATTKQKKKAKRKN